jgi:hypothetical protein
VLDFEEQQDAVDLLFPLLSAESFDEQQAAPFLLFVLSPSADVDALDALSALPPRFTLLAEEPASFVWATSEVEVFEVELASVCAFTAKAKNAKTLKINTFFILSFGWLD